MNLTVPNKSNNANQLIELLSLTFFSVSYMAHLEGTGDTDFFQDGQFCGTRGQSRRVEGMLVHVGLR